MNDITLMDENQIRYAKRSLYVLLLQKQRKTESELVILVELAKDYAVHLPVADGSVNKDCG